MKMTDVWAAVSSPIRLEIFILISLVANISDFFMSNPI